MKILFIIIFMMTMIRAACSQNLLIKWDPNDQADTHGLTHYTVYKWEGDSTRMATWDQSQMDSIGILPHVLNFAGPYEFPTFFDETMIIRAGLIANDSLKRKSKMIFTKFYPHPGPGKSIWIGL